MNDSHSPDGVIKVNDVILGAGGKPELKRE